MQDEEDEYGGMSSESEPEPNDEYHGECGICKNVVFRAVLLPCCLTDEVTSCIGRACLPCNRKHSCSNMNDEKHSNTPNKKPDAIEMKQRTLITYDTLGPPSEEDLDKGEMLELFRWWANSMMLERYMQGSNEERRNRWRSLLRSGRRLSENKSWKERRTTTSRHSKRVCCNGRLCSAQSKLQPQRSQQVSRKKERERV